MSSYSSLMARLLLLEHTLIEKCDGVIDIMRLEVALIVNDV